jgi:tungstate transport system permease protein
MVDYIIEGIIEGFKLLIGLDQDVYKIIGLSVFVSSISTLLAAIIGVPLGIYTGLKNFPLKTTYARLVYTLMSLPPVVVGLVVALFLSRKGPLGFMGFLYSPTAMIIAQTLLVTPIIVGNIFNHTKEHGLTVYNLGKTLGAGRLERFFLLLSELRVAVLIALVSGLGRAISEVGAVMIVGGNIQGSTRVMTSYIAMNHNMGNYGMSIAMGMVLLVIAFLLNSILYTYMEGEKHETIHTKP